MIYGVDVLHGTKHGVPPHWWHWGVGVPKPPQCAWPCWCGGFSESGTLSSCGSALVCAGRKKPEGFCDLEGIPQPGEQQPGGMMNRALLNLSSPAALLRCANSYS